MIIHHMRDASIRHSIEGMVIPMNFDGVYKMAQMSKREHQNGNSNTSRNFSEKQILDRQT
jgi:hypothetical protein